MLYAIALYLALGNKAVLKKLLFFSISQTIQFKIPVEAFVGRYAGAGVVGAAG